MTEATDAGGYEQMTIPELRREIHTRLGISGLERSGLTALAMNSLVAYITGNLPTSPAKLYSNGGVNKLDLQKKIAQKALLDEWADHRDETGNARKFSKDELIKILEHMDDVGDQREWSGEPTELGDNAE